MTEIGAVVSVATKRKELMWTVGFSTHCITLSLGIAGPLVLVETVSDGLPLLFQSMDVRSNSSGILPAKQDPSIEGCHLFHIIV